MRDDGQPAGLDPETVAEIEAVLDGAAQDLVPMAELPDAAPPWHQYRRRVAFRRRVAMWTLLVVLSWTPFLAALVYSIAR